MRVVSRSSAPISLAESRGAATSAEGRSGPPTLDRHLLDYVRILVKRRWAAVATLAVIVTLAVVHLQTATPIYEATVQLLIEHDTENFSLQSGVTQDRETTDFYNTQYTILQSRSLASRTLAAMNAWTHPELAQGTLEQTSIFSGVFRAATRLVQRLRGEKNEAAPAAAAPPPSAGTQETPAQTRAIDALLARLTISPVKTSRLVDVKVRAGDPKFAAGAANALAKAYIDQNLEIRISASKETTDWLTEQLSAQRERINTSEQALQKYRENNDAVSLEDRQNIVAQKLSDLNAMVTKAKGDRIAREAVYNQVLAIQKQEASLDTLPAILSNSYLQQLKADISRLQGDLSKRSQELGDRNPVIVELRTSIAAAEAKFRQELAKQVEAMGVEVDAARTLEHSLTQALEAQKTEVMDMNRTGITYSALEREVTTNRQIFDSLLARTREKGISGELKASDVRVIDPAQVPQSPVWPKRNRTLLYSVFFGLLLGVAFAFVFEYVDDRIKTPDEIKAYLSLPFLGMIPAVTEKDGTRPLLHDRETYTPLFSEAFRSVRTNVVFTAENRARSIVVTSTGPGEGKTLVAANLAIGLAMTGRTVAFVDVDMRRPQVHEMFGMEKEPGLSDLLIGKAKGWEVLRKSPVQGLHVMPSGASVGNPAELLSSPRFERMLGSLLKRFDWVILDSPPVAAVTDASIVANRAAAVLFVVGAQTTTRAAALNALEQLETADATFLGAVLNRVHLRRDAYYYSPYYKRAYEKYYMPAAQADEVDVFDHDESAVDVDVPPVEKVQRG
ncbi:MAG: polysaccharide biosynthesis tyrosine autokinase [Acidobacteria bacterium]|nr:polysaccharide biosynthesis tyrosine autokinase [Acidobacteriota bacterium]